MNSFVITVGSYVRPLLDEAKAVAREIGQVSVNAGETACEVRVALASIEKVEAAGRGWGEAEDDSLLGGRAGLWHGCGVVIYPYKV